jgi:diguanylate cyclase (GGDEF)-like protein
LKLSRLFDHANDNLFEKYGIIALWMAIAVHLIFLYIFWSNSVTEMAYFNIGSVLLFGSTIFLYYRRQYSLVLALAHLEVIIHAMMATYYIGLESGFYYYLFVLVTVVFVTRDRTVNMKVAKIIFFMTLFFIFELLFTHITPPYLLDSELLRWLRYMNLFGFVAISTPILFYYIRMTEQNEDTLYHYATHDPLTSLVNRRYLVNMAEYVLLQKEEEPLCIILSDIDFFKTINDEYGHQCGDEVLIEISKKLKSRIREEDILARWGGEEFLFLMPRFKLDEAMRFAQQLRHEIESTPYPCNNDLKLKITMTFGIAEHIEGESFDMTLARADKALYQGKHNMGRNCVALAKQ